MKDDGYLDNTDYQLRKLILMLRDNGGCNAPKENKCKLKKNHKRYPDTIDCLECGKSWEYVKLAEDKDGYYDITGKFIYTPGEYGWRPYNTPTKSELKKSWLKRVTERIDKVMW